MARRSKKDVEATVGGVVDKEDILKQTYDERGLPRRKIDDKQADSVFAEFAQRQILHETTDAETLKNALYMRSGCLPFDLVTEGKGIPRGCSTLLYSAYGAGKSTLLFTAARGLCMNGYKVLYVDSESSDNTARKMGLLGPDETLLVPKGSFKYLTAKYYFELDRISEMFVKSSYDVIFIDSITNIGISPDGEKKNNSNKTIEDASAVGAEARVQSKWIKKFYLRLKGTDQALVFISQERNKIDIRRPQNNGPKAAVGNAISFTNNIQIHMRPSTLIKEGIRVVGRKAYLMSEKTRDSDGFIEIPVTVIFGRGVSNIEMLKDMGKWMGLLVQKGAYWDITIPNQSPVRVQGQVNLNKWIKDNYDTLVDIFYDKAPEFLLYIANGGKGSDSDGSASSLFATETSDVGDEEDMAREELETEGTPVEMATEEDIESALSEADETLTLD